MSTWLRQSTAVDVMLGPALDSVDGNTVEGSLTITQPDIRLSKNGGAFAQKSAAQTLSHGENGWYPANLSTTDTNTLGVLIAVIHEAGALQIWREFMVVPANVYDSFFSTDLLQVDMTQWLGTAPLALSSQLVQVMANGINTGAVNNAALGTDTGLKSIRSATCEGGASGSITLDGSASSVNDFYKGTRIYLTVGTGAGQSRICTAYNGTTKVATIEPNWITNPASGTTAFTILTDASALSIATGGIAFTSFAANAIGDVALAPDVDSYAAKIGLLDDDDGDADRYEVAWFKNGTWITSGITSPTIQVVKSSDASNLIAETAMTEIGSLHLFKKTESTNRVADGATYWAIARATIDGSVREWPQIVGRDS